MSNNFNRFISYFFFSNIFLGLTAIALCIETNIQTGLTLNYIPFYGITFLGTAIYYTVIYVKNVQARYYNERTLWYRRNLSYILQTLRFIIFVALAIAVFMVLRNLQRFASLTQIQWLLLFVFPLLAVWYTTGLSFLSIKNIRQAGFIKPFVIGLTWAGFVTVYPVIVWQLQKGCNQINSIYPPLLLFIQNFIFISNLALLFDIKDYRNDSMHYLKTFPVLLGIRQTIYKVVLPIFLLNIFVVIAYVVQQQLHSTQIILLSIPYAFLGVVIFKTQQPKKLLYYLAGVDGLMLLKAICGITAFIIKK